MAVKVKLYAITNEACGPKFIGPVSTAPNETYAKFREFLEIPFLCKSIVAGCYRWQHRMGYATTGI
jgi:hypothetical protein